MLSSNLIAETWGRPIMIPWCGVEGNLYTVENAELIQFASFEWKQTQDHSKWAIAVSDSSSFSCFGDMNRMESQFKRGGAFYCLENRKLRDSLKSMIKGKNVCQSPWFRSIYNQLKIFLGVLEISLFECNCTKLWEKAILQLFTIFHQILKQKAIIFNQIICFLK